MQTRARWTSALTLATLFLSCGLATVRAADSWKAPTDDYMKKVMSSAGYRMADVLPSKKVSKKTKLRVYTFFAGLGLTAWQSVAKEYQKYQPNVTVEFVNGDWATYVDKAYAMISAGTAPDILFCEQGMAPYFIGNNLLLSLDKFIKADKFQDVLDDYFQPVLKRYTYNGGLYCLPTDTSPSGMLYYNKKMLAESGLPIPKNTSTWDEFIPVLKKLAIPGKRDGLHVNTDRAFVYTYGGTMADNYMKPTKFTFDSPKAVQGLQLEADLIQRYKVMIAPWSKGSPEDLFKKEKLAFLVSGMWSSPDPYTFDKFDFDVAMMPSGSGGPPTMPTGGTGLGIAQGTRNQEIAWDFIKFACGPFGECLTASASAQPALKRLFNTELFAKNDVKPANKRILQDLANAAVYEPFSRVYPKYDAVWSTEFGKVWSGKASVKQAVDSALPAMQRILEYGKRK